MKRNLKLVILTIVLSVITLFTACNDTMDYIQRAVDNNSSFNSSFVHGTVEKNKYVNETLDLTVELDEKWTFATDDELAESNGLNDMSSKNVSSAINGGALQEMKAVRDEDNANILLMVEDLSDPKYASIDEEDVRDEIYSKIDASFTSKEMIVDKKEKTTITFMGKKAPGIKIIASYNGRFAYEYEVFQKSKQYLVMLHVTSVISEKEAEEFIDKFSIFSE